MKDAPLRYVAGDPIAFVVLNEITIIAQLARTAVDQALQPHLTAAGFGLLNHLARLPGDWTPVRLARAFQLTKGAITNTVQKLEARGYVGIEPARDDARSKFIRLTEAGRAARDTALVRLAPLLAELATAAPDLDFADAAPFLARLRAVMDAARG